MLKKLFCDPVDGYAIKTQNKLSHSRLLQPSKLQYSRYPWYAIAISTFISFILVDTATFLGLYHNSVWTCCLEILLSLLLEPSSHWLKVKMLAKIRPKNSDLEDNQKKKQCFLLFLGFFLYQECYIPNLIKILDMSISKKHSIYLPFPSPCHESFVF